MSKPWWVLGAVVAIGAYVAFVSMSAESASRPGREAPRPPKPAPIAASSSSASSGSSPKAVVDVLEHDFGVFDPMEKGSHTFTIRNAGDAPLELEKGPVTCQCTLLDFPAKIAPGKAGDVRVSWTTKTKYQAFHQQAALSTNDPSHPALVFSVKGEVRAHLLADPDEVVFGTLSPGGSQTLSTTLYSQVWDDFEITRIKASSPAVTWSAKPAPAETLAPLKALSGHVLEVSSPAQPANGYGTRSAPATLSGHFQENLTIYVAPKGRASEERHYDLLVSGKRTRWLSVQGDELRFGALSVGQGAQRRLTLLIRDAQQKLKIQRVETTPAFLRTTLRPVRPESSKTESSKTESWCSLYYLDVAVPPDAPECTHLGLDAGELRIFADDPSQPVITQPLELAVIRER